ncbi:sensor histidine kinase [Massilia sp. TS11]|uniref:sensor histidine kinase n=1 Tax=Massilia sp. TS11 TaxID=2908003 RepID=UPI001EDC0F06|nr:histidine kinase [Massilia sp. TS11]MCG2585696.1 histidine kinase [Massilia sp. TS11]
MSPARPPFPLGRFLRDGVFAMLLNVLCALTLTYVLGNGGGFGPNLLASMCIGTLAWAMIDGGRLLIWGECARPNWLVFAGLVAVAVPVAQVAGMTLTGLLLGARINGFSSLSRTSMTGVAFTLIATGAATLFFTSRDRILRAEARAAQQEAHALQARLQALQAQIEPHMLFNTLANVQGLIALDPARAQHMLDQLIQYLRATLSSSRAEVTTLGQEFALLDAYLGLMQVRMGERLRYQLALAPELAACQLPPLLLQPLVENAIIHGLEPKIDGGTLSVRASRDAGRLLLEVADSGLGLAAAPASKGTRLGLANTRERLQALYGSAARLELLPNSPEGALARLTLPLTP